jgi:hypothetical protein
MVIWEFNEEALSHLLMYVGWKSFQEHSIHLCFAYAPLCFEELRDFCKFAKVLPLGLDAGHLCTHLVVRDCLEVHNGKALSCMI